MITKNDCTTLLLELEDSGVQINNYLKQLIIAKDVPIEVLKFLAEHKNIEVIDFYNTLRIKHNKSKSPLYTNIISDTLDEQEAVITLSSLLTQIFLYTKMAKNKEIFLSAVRANEIISALDTYITTGDAIKVIKLLRLIRSDMFVLEYVDGRREL